MCASLQKKVPNGVGAAHKASQLLQEKFATTHKGESAKEKLQDMLNLPLDQDTILALRALASVDGKARVDLSALGLSADDLAVLGQDLVAAQGHCSLSCQECSRAVAVAVAVAVC